MNKCIFQLVRILFMNCCYDVALFPASALFSEGFVSVCVQIAMPLSTVTQLPDSAKRSTK